MTDIIKTGSNDLVVILERLNDMPMTRKYGKGLVARIPTTEEDQPAGIYIRVSSSKQADQGQGSLL